MEISHEDVTKLLEAIDGAPRLGQIDLVRNGFRLQIDRGLAASSNTGSVAGAAMPSAAAVKAVAKSDAVMPEGEIVIRAPMIGRFYCAHPIDRPTLPQQGERVGADEVVCVIELGGQSNAVKAGVNGLLKSLVADHGSLVEYGQELLIITPAAEG